MEASFGRIIIYAKNLDKMRTFYEKFFGYKSRALPNDLIVDMISPYGGASILLHPAGKGLKTGQVTVKLVFDVKDVEKFSAQCLKNGLKFGTIHQADGYCFANAKDPDKNSVQISNRKFADR